MTPATQPLPPAQIDLQDLPPEVVDELPPDILRKLQDGILDQLPDDVVESLPSSIQDQIPEGLLEAASSNPTMTTVLLVIGVIAVAGFVFGVVKSAVKWMIYSAILGVAAWYFFFQQ